MVRWLLLILLGIGLAGCGSATSKEPINLGHLVPLSGPERERGRQAQQAVQLAVEEINADGKGVLGRPLHVRQVDTRGEAETAQGETVRLLSLHRCVAVIAGPDAALGPVVVRTAHPYTTTAVVPGELAEALQGEGVICLAVNPGKRGQMLAQYAAKELKAKRAVVLTELGNGKANAEEKPNRDATTRDTSRPERENPVAASVAARFLDEWDRAVTSKVEQLIVPDLAVESELPTILAASKADVVLVCASVAKFLELRARCHAAKVTTPLLYGGEDRGVRPLRTDDAGPDVYLATMLATENLSERARELAKKYEERFHEPPGLAAFQAYDAVRLVAETMQNKNSTSAADLRTALYELGKFDSVLGTVAWKDHQTRRDMFVVRLHDKQTEVVQTVKADD
jgi:branched-chain amino acid transport system substrate-binding protein